MVKKGLSGVFLLSLELLVFFPAHMAQAARLPPIVLDESDRVCWRIYGSMDTMQDCLLRAAHDEEESVKHRLSEIFIGIDDLERNEIIHEYIKNYEKNYIQTCNVLYYKQYEEGSLSRTEPIRCIYYIMNNRNNVLETIYGTLSMYDESIMTTYFQEYHNICWNPNGWINENACLQENLNLAQENLRHWAGLIFGEDFDESEEDIEKAFRDAQGAWREDVDLTCGRLMRLLHAQKPLEEQMVLWCRYVMTRERERLLLRLYEFNLHQIDISVRN